MKGTGMMSVLCLPSIFNYICITDHHYPFGSTKASFFHQRQLRKHKLHFHQIVYPGETTIINFLKGNFRLEMLRKHENGKSGRMRAQCSNVKFSRLWMLWILMNTKNRILITCTFVACEGERRVTQVFATSAKETNETTNLIKMHYFSNPQAARGWLGDGLWVLSSVYYKILLNVASKKYEMIGKIWN